MIINDKELELMIRIPEYIIDHLIEKCVESECTISDLVQRLIKEKYKIK